MGDIPTPRKRPPGRRVGDSGTREAILDAARDLFAARGYQLASIRAIATAAGVDPALIRHFFGDKEALFTATVADRTTVPQRMLASFDGDAAGVGARLTDTYLRLWEEPETRPILLSLARSAVTSDRAAQMLFEVMGARLRDADGVAGATDQRMRRVVLAASHLLGVAIARYVMKAPPIAELSHDELVAEISPAIQHYLAGPAES
jgi:AcrR family transcriptional regulator